MMKKKTKTNKREKDKIYPNAQRIVVDEIFENGKDGLVRILRSRRLPGFSRIDFGIHTWGDEKEDFITQWRIEAFVGFSTHRKLKEGDVFIIEDGRKLDDYKTREKVLPRDVAKKIHLIMHWDHSIKSSRTEIKIASHKLTITEISPKPDEVPKLNKIVDDKAQKKWE